jgi:hypothetical protein
MKSFILGILMTGSTLFYADYSYGTLAPCDMLAKERARDALANDGFSLRLVDLAVAKWRAHKVEDLTTAECVIGVGEEWYANVKGLVGKE